MRKYLVFIFLCFTILTSFTEEYEIFDKVLKTNEGNIQIYVKFIDKENKIISAFYAAFENDKSRKKIVYFENKIVYDINGKKIIDFSKHELVLFGYKLELSYPKNKKYSPGIILSPYFGSKNSVGDSDTIEWDKNNNTFFKQGFNIP